MTAGYDQGTWDGTGGHPTPTWDGPDGWTFVIHNEDTAGGFVTAPGALDTLIITERP